MRFIERRIHALPSRGSWRAIVGVVLRALGIGVISALVSHAVAQTPYGLFDQTIDEDLQAQAEAAMSDGDRQRALLLLNEVVRRDPRQAGALLDAAILYCQLGERTRSQETLARIEAKYDVPPAIEKLIVFYRASACTPSGPRPQLIASVGAGVTSNANFGPSNPVVTFAPSAPVNSLTLAPESLAHGDQYIESAVQGELPISSVPGLTLLAGLTNRQYRSQHSFDQRSATIGLADRTSVMRGELYNQLTADMLWLGTRVYQRDIGWHANFWLPPSAWRSMLARGGLDLTVLDSAYPGNSLYDSVYVEVRAAFQARIGERTSVQLFVGPAWDKPLNGRPGGSQHGYSAWLSADYDMARHGQLEAVLQQRTLIDADAYDPVFFGTLGRHQTLRAASLRYTFPMVRGWSVYAQASAGRISNSISLFAYSVYSGSLGLSWKY
ncbi:tetratricopeptide repeat protein [Paraburkholderia youngii]|uniref:tetratricopeptide repeat protein n=1 Tax=Paraburkholderia youngii TaxID=2782701 RepID=UPI003D1C361D